MKVRVCSAWFPHVVIELRVCERKFACLDAAIVWLRFRVSDYIW